MSSPPEKVIGAGAPFIERLLVRISANHFDKPPSKLIKFEPNARRQPQRMNGMA